jgi:hypothetical protein
MPPRSDASTRRLPKWFIAAILICLSTRIYFCLAPVPQTTETAVKWVGTNALTIRSGKPLFLYLDNESSQSARDEARLFSDPAIASLINSSFSPRRIDTTDMIALALMGPDLMKLKRQSAIIVFGKDGKPAAQVATFIPRRSLLQLLREIELKKPSGK